MSLILLKDSFISSSKLVWKICLAKWTLYTELVKSFLLTQIKDNIGWQHVKQLWQDSKGRQRNIHILILSVLEAGSRGEAASSRMTGQLWMLQVTIEQVTFMSIFNGIMTLFPISQNMTKTSTFVVAQTAREKTNWVTTFLIQKFTGEPHGCNY